MTAEHTQRSPGHPPDRPDPAPYRPEHVPCRPEHAQGLPEHAQGLLAARLARERAAWRVPSLAAGLVRDGQLAWSAECGGTGITPAPAAAAGPPAGVQYRAGSITKTLVAVAVLRLRDGGRISLDDPVGEHLDAAGAIGAATIRQLLSHTSGLRAETAGPWWERTPGGSFGELAADSLGADAARWPPGRRFHYSNVGYALLGELLARAHAAPWATVISRELLRPLGMTRTTTRPQPPCARGFAVHPHADLLLPEPEHCAGAMAPAGQLWTTVGDLAAWARFLSGDTGGLLAPSTLAEMREPLAVEDLPDQPWTAAYGLGLQLWNRAGRRSYGHAGSMPGFTGLLEIDGTSADAAIVLGNSTAGFGPELTGDLLAVLAGARPVSPGGRPPGSRPPGSRPPAPDVADLLGTWYWGPRPYTLSASGETLILQEAGSRERRFGFRRAGRETWVGLDGYHAGEPLTAVRDADGSAVLLDIGSFAFTRTPYDPAGGVPGGVDPGGWQAWPPGPGRI